MIFLPKGKLARRVAVLVLVTVLASITFSLTVMLTLQTRDAVAGRRSSIESLGLVYASALADPIEARDRQSTLMVLRSITRLPQVRYIAVADADGQQVASLGQDATSDQFVCNESLTLLFNDTCEVSVDIVKAGRRIGYVVVAADISDLRDTLFKSLLITIGSLLTGGAASLWVGLKLQQRITGPLSALINTISGIRRTGDYSVNVSHVSNDETGQLVSTFNDMMSEVRTRDRELQSLAYSDSLTGLANRKLFHEELAKCTSRCLATGKSAALFLLDLDGFKQINDTLGHSFGDRLLVAVAEELSKSSRAGSLLARLGGDEFAFIVSDVSEEDAAIDFAGPLVASFLKPLQLGQNMVDITTSIGCSLIPRDGHSVEELFRNADLALYSAKREGRGRMHFYREEMLRALMRSTEMAHELARAAERGELTVAYQPQIRLSDEAVVGFEALLRWTHPRLGSISPAVFVPLAESNGMMEELGSWILQAACRQAAAWLNAGHPTVEIAVNVSAVQLNTRFPEEVKAVLAESGIAPQSLCLELTESVYAGRHTASVESVMNELKAIGVKLALDDFGTGFSSLSSLGNMPFDKLKIDRSFVQDVPHNAKRQRLLQGIIKLGSALGCAIVAEGAENGPEVAFLRANGVDVVQGYYFSKPLDAQEAIRLITHGSVPGTRFARC